MSISLTHRDFRAVQSLPFCYACTKYFERDEPRQKDHIPPKSCFAPVDRVGPLWLPAHPLCNAAHSVADERIGQLISLKHGKIAAPHRRRLRFIQAKDHSSGETFVAVNNIDIRGEIERWVRAFHAALYRAPMPLEARFGIETPFSVGVPTERGILLDKGRKQHRLFVSLLRTNGLAKNLDSLTANSGKLRYLCVWERATNGRWLCVFGLDLYDWRDLGKISPGGAKGCTGFYQMPSGSAPVVASKATKVVSATNSGDPLDPFN